MSMQEPNQMREKYIKGFLKDILINSIRALKDEDYQKRIWFRFEGPEVDSYLDTIIHFIDRCEALFEEPNCINDLGNENYAFLKKLYDLVLEHLHATENRINVEQLQENELLDDPKWHEIQILASIIDVKIKECIGGACDEQL